MDDLLQTPGDVWTGLVRTHGAAAATCLAHGQSALVKGIEFEEDRLVALYNMKKVYDETSAAWLLLWQNDSIYVFHPGHEGSDPKVCQGSVCRHGRHRPRP